MSEKDLRLLEKFYLPVREASLMTVSEEGTILDIKGKALMQSNKHIANVSDRYNLISNREVIENVLDNLDNSGLDYYIQPGLSAVTHKKMQMLLVFPELKFKDPIEGDNLLGFSLHNSYDGSCRIKAFWQTLRLVCTNGAVRVKSNIASFYFRKHTKNADVKMISQISDKGENEIKYLEETYNKMANTRFDMKQTNEFWEKSEKFVGKRITKTAFDIAYGIKVESEFGLFNVFTSVVSHHEKMQPIMRFDYLRNVSKLFNV